MRPVLAFFAFASFACAQDIILPDGKAKTLIQNTCTECHGLDVVVSASMSPEEWKTTVDEMVKRGATLSKDEKETVLEYLTVYFAADKININTVGQNPKIGFHARSVNMSIALSPLMPTV